MSAGEEGELSRPNRKRLRLHNVRVPDDLWGAAQDIADSRTESLAVVLRRALREYVERYSDDGRNTP